MVKSCLCPYCGKETIIINPDLNDYDEVSYISKHNEPIITDSFFESVGTSSCELCKQNFDYIIDQRGRLRKK